jgi:hypothetical protein
MRRLVLLVVAITMAADAFAHIAPSVDDNNRFLKVTPQADRVRLAYTVFFGENPGRAMRPTLDTDKNGQISDDEAQVLGNRVAAEVLAAMELAVDGKQQRFAWKAVSVGLGTPDVRGGSFSVDMIAYVCFASARGKHAVHVLDRFRVPKPGETEVRVDDSLGIKVERAKIGDASALNNDFKFVGPGGPLGDTGLDIAFVADERAQMSNECAAAPASGSGAPWMLIGIAAAIAAIIAGVIIYTRRR